MDTVNVEYRLHFGDGMTLIHSVGVARRREAVPADMVALPAWTRLDYSQCPHCPLHAADVAYCPAAVALAPLVEKLAGRDSYASVRLEVRSRERTVTAETTLQRAASSLFGLVIAGSGCPHTRFLLPMARFHLPLADEQETLFRVSGTYLLHGYFLRPGGDAGDVGLDGLKAKYAQLHVMNRALAGRLRGAGREDAPVNAVVLLDLLAKGVPSNIDDSLDELRGWFQWDPPGEDDTGKGG